MDPDEPPRSVTSSRLGPLLERVGQVVRAKWTITDLLGSGGMAGVYSARHRNGRRAALKIMHRTHSGDPDLVERFLREGWLANQIDHPARVECFDDDATEAGEPFLVLELLEGETLDALWKRNDRRLTVPAALSVAEKLLDFLTACHAAGIVHRDLKPANVFLTRGGLVKILDFGVAHHRAPRADETRTGVALGTPSFMAPEQARGRHDLLDGRADIFAVGAILFALLSGHRLHEGKNGDEALIAAATERAPSVGAMIAELPRDVVDVVDRALQWEPEKRWADAEEMRRAIVALEAREALSVAGTSEPWGGGAGDDELELVLAPRVPASPSVPPVSSSLPPPMPSSVRSELELAVGASIEELAHEDRHASPAAPKVKLWTPIRRGSIPPPTTERPSPSASAEGTLARVPFPLLLAQIARRAFSGTLVVTEPEGASHALFFDGGRPVRGRTDARGKSLLSAMTNAPPPSVYALHAGLEAIVHGWEPAPSDPLSAILAAVREWADEARIEAVVAALPAKELRLHPAAQPHRFSVTSEEKEILDAIKAGWLTLRDMLEAYPSREGVVRRLVYALAITRHLDLGRPGTWPIAAPGAPRAPERDPEATIPDLPPSPSEGWDPGGSDAPTGMK